MIMAKAIIVIIVTALILTVAIAVTEPDAPVIVDPSGPPAAPKVALIDRLTKPPAEYIADYGDTIESRLVYNFLILRSNDVAIASTINKLHPAIRGIDN